MNQKINFRKAFFATIVVMYIGATGRISAMVAKTAQQIAPALANTTLPALSNATNQLINNITNSIETNDSISMQNYNPQFKNIHHQTKPFSNSLYQADANNRIGQELAMTWQDQGNNPLSSESAASTLPTNRVEKTPDYIKIENDATNMSTKEFSKKYDNLPSSQKNSSSSNNPFGSNLKSTQKISQSTSSQQARNYATFAPPSNNPYDILGVSRTATQKEIKAAHMKLVKQYHPDVNLNNKEEATKALQIINGAYDKLSNQNQSVDNSSTDNSSYNYSAKTYDPYNEPRDFSGSDEQYYAKASSRAQRERAYKAANPRSFSEALDFSSDERIRQYLKEHPEIDINKRDNTKLSNSLVDAIVYKNNLRMVQLLIDLGADVNKGDMHPQIDPRIAGKSPLLLACNLSQELIGSGCVGTTKDGIILALLKAGADVNAIDNNGDTPLLKLIERGFYIPEPSENLGLDRFITFEAYKNVIQELINKGADVNHANKQGVTPLKSLKENFYYTAHYKRDNNPRIKPGQYDEIVNLLKQAGARETIDHSAKQYSDQDSSGW